MTAPGDLNRRLTPLEPVETADDEGGVVHTYQTLTTLWAQVKPRSAGAAVSAASVGAALRYEIVIRYRDDVTTRHQLQDGAHLYRVSRAGADACDEGGAGDIRRLSLVAHGGYRALTQCRADQPAGGPKVYESRCTRILLGDDMAAFRRLCGFGRGGYTNNA